VNKKKITSKMNEQIKEAMYMAEKKFIETKVDLSFYDDKEKILFIINNYLVIKDISVFNQHYWFYMLFLISKHLNLEIKEIEYENVEAGSALIELNEYYENVMNEKVTKLSFGSLYPSVLYKCLYRLNKNDYFSKVFRYIYEIYRTDKKELSQEANLVIKYWLNYTYGIILRYNLCDCVTFFNSQKSIVCKGILNEFKGHIIYFDCDTVYFHNFNEISTRFNNHINKLNEKVTFLSYDIIEMDLFYITGKRKYIEIGNKDNVKFKGILKK
jgi:hypothetical protein